MTDTTDIKALVRPIRERYDWSNAVWRECDHCGKQHTGTVTAEDGSQICAHCADQIYWSAWQVLAERALDQLETERQRADMTNQQYLRVVSERNDVTGELEELKDELSELKGEQVPVGELYVDTEQPPYCVRRVRWFNAMPEVGTQLFTAPKKPVVKLAGGMTRGTMYAMGWNDRGLADKLTIEADGGIVKDGE